MRTRASQKRLRYTQAVTLHFRCYMCHKKLKALIPYDTTQEKGYIARAHCSGCRAINFIAIPLTVPVSHNPHVYMG